MRATFARRIATCAASVAFALATTPTRAETCAIPGAASPKLATLDASERIAFIHRVMDQQARYARTWKWAWVGIGSATVVVSFSVAAGYAASTSAAREANVVDNLVAGAVSIATPIVTLFLAPRVESDAPKLDALLRDTNGGAAGACMVVARAEELLAKSAEDEDFATGWIAHTTSILGAGALFAFMAVEAALATDSASRDAHWQNAIINGAAGIAYAELQILTTPTGASSAYTRYLKGDLHDKSHPRVTVLPTVGGLALGVTF
jgi:hypothetical protein